MQRLYKISKGHYIFSVILPALLTLGLMIWSLYWIIVDAKTTFRLSLLSLSGLMFFDYVVALSHTQMVTIDDNQISFQSLGRVHTYAWDDIVRINIRPVSLNKRIYVRINDASILKGRYWLHLDFMENGQELRDYLEALMESRHPKLKNLNQSSFNKTK